MTYFIILILGLYLVSASVSAESGVKLSVSVLVSAESNCLTFGLVSVSAETENSLSVGLYSKVPLLHHCL